MQSLTNRTIVSRGGNSDVGINVPNSSTGDANIEDHPAEENLYIQTIMNVKFHPLLLPIQNQLF